MTSSPAMETDTCSRSAKWRTEYARTLNEFIDEKQATHGFVVYRGRERYRSGQVDGLPVAEFLRLLYTDAFHGRARR